MRTKPIDDIFKKTMLKIMKKWKTKDQILSELLEYRIAIDERYFRQMIENYNNEYAEHLTNGWYIAHDVEKGYKLTKSRKDIKNSLTDNHKRAMTMLKAESKVKKAMGEDLNMFAEDVIKQIKNA